MIRFNLNWPVSLNQYWGFFRGRWVVTTKGKKYKKYVEQFVFNNGLDLKLKGSLRFEMSIHQPTARKCDIDNFTKGLWDAFTDAGLWEDDSQVDELIIKRGCKDRNKEGFVAIEIKQI